MELDAGLFVCKIMKGADDGAPHVEFRDGTPVSGHVKRRIVPAVGVCKRLLPRVKQAAEDRQESPRGCITKQCTIELCGDVEFEVAVERAAAIKIAAGIPLPTTSPTKTANFSSSSSMKS